MKLSVRIRVAYTVQRRASMRAMRSMKRTLVVRGRGAQPSVALPVTMFVAQSNIYSDYYGFVEWCVHYVYTINTRRI
jgi:hypothetical protein